MTQFISALPRLMFALIALALMSHAPQANAQANVLTGPWSGSMTWNGGQAGSSTWTFAPDGTFFTDGGSTGRWSLNGSALWMRYDASPYSTLTGSVTNSAVVADGATADGANIAVHLRLSRQTAMGAPSIQGTWTITKIRNGSVYGTYYYTFYGDGTFSEPTGGTGRWNQTGGRIWFRYNESPHTTFVGAYDPSSGAFQGDETWEGGEAGATFVMSR